MEAYPIIYILFAHFLADFVFQDDVMLNYKGKSIGWLFIHIGLYMTAMLIIMLLGTLIFAWTWKTALIYVLINGCTHFTLEYFTSKVNVKSWDENRIHHYFVGQGFDQFVHVSILIYTYFLFK